jgi:hypothetical protein
MNSCFNHYFNQSDFWDLSFNDIATAFIALVNIFLILYIFIYQRKKNNEDHNFILAHIDFNLKSEWFKSVILEPNISALHDFFVKIYNQFSTADTQLNDSKRSEIINKINSNCNKIEFRFISVLGCVDQNLENQCIEIIDTLRDNISVKLMTSGDIRPEDYQAYITTSKRELISKLYNFIPKDLK